MENNCELLGSLRSHHSWLQDCLYFTGKLGLRPAPEPCHPHWKCEGGEHWILPAVCLPGVKFQQAFPAKLDIEKKHLL